MAKDLIPLSTPDISALAKSLRGQLATRGTLPSHVEILNMLARASGHRNFQHYRARPAATEPPAATERAQQALRYFDERGRFAHWPARTSVQDLCRGIWSGVAARRVSDEREISTELNGLHLFGDAAILRRTLCRLGLMTRTPDGREYRRVERTPPPDAATLITEVSRRRRPTPPPPSAGG